MSKIHWSGESGWALACGSDIETAQHRKDIEAREFVAKHTESPDLYCKRCADVARKMPPPVRFIYTLTREEREQVRALLEYVGRSYVGPEARKGLDVLTGKVGHD